MKKKTYPLVYSGIKQQYARSVAVGDLVFLSGLGCLNAETGEVTSTNLADQVKITLDKIRTALTEAGTSMENIVKTTIYLKRIEDHDIMRQTEKEYWQKFAPRLLEEPPASTVIQAAALINPDMLVEIEAIAIISR